MEESIMFTIQSTYFLVTLLLLLILYLIVGAVWKKQKLKAGQYFLVISFSVYLLCVIHLVFFPIEVNIGKYANQTPLYKSINFIPILTIDVKTFLLNIIMLVPFGMYLPLLNKKVESIRSIAYYGFFFSLSIEGLQMVIRIFSGSGRSTDINDLIANTVGAIVGFILIRGLLKKNMWNNVWNKIRL